MRNFILIGAAGFVAPRHMRAIAETGNQLLAAFDPNDSVGIIDSYFPEASFFTEFERFDRHIEKLKLSGTSIDYLSVCSPNYLHDAHIRFGLRHDAHVICEKPLVINPWNVDALERVAADSKGSAYTILQLRLHDEVRRLKKQIDAAGPDANFDVELTYITSRGNWYYTSWKGDEEKSGGIMINIGVHFFDMLLWLFGNVQKVEIHRRSHDSASGYFKFAKARVRWFLGINDDYLPEEIKQSGQRTYRILKFNDDAFDFSKGFEGLHTKSYEHILNGEGFLISEAKPAIDLLYKMRKSPLTTDHTHAHPMSDLPQSPHPFKHQ